MCGICGYQYRTDHQPTLNLAAGIEALRHRGPDAQGALEEKDTGLGHTRLSILDLSEAGAQPMASPCRRYVIVFNGEIYNFRELRADLEKRGETFSGHSDTEVLLRLFIREGLERCLRRLRGMFAFAVWDRHEDSLYLARDRLGVKPLVYAETDAAFLFGSEIPALFALDAGLSRQADHEALDHYLSFQYIPSPRSGFQAVRKLEPAHALVVKGGRIQRRFHYWDIDFSRRTTLAYDQACEALREKVLEATRLRLIADVPLGAFLSGGVDSSITVAAMTRLMDRPVKTYSIGFDDPNFDETRYARQAAEHLGTDHHERIVTPEAAALLPRIVAHHGEPFADNSSMPTYYVSEFARRSVTVALTGDGPDEVFGGYRRFQHAVRADRIERLGLMPLWRLLRRSTVALENRLHPDRKPKPFPETRADQSLRLHGMDRYKQLFAFFTDDEKARLYTDRFKRAATNSDTGAYYQTHYDRSAGADPINRYLYLDMKTYMVEDVLYKVDIASMMPSLECRSPFLDHELIEFAYTLPGAWKLNNGETKRILKDAFEDWLPPGFMRRGKMGFSAPMPAWLRGDLRPLVETRLLESPTLNGLFDKDQVRRRITEHMNATRSHSKQIWTLLVLAEWLEQARVSL